MIHLGGNTIVKAIEKKKKEKEKRIRCTMPVQQLFDPLIKRYKSTIAKGRM